MRTFARAGAATAALTMAGTLGLGALTSSANAQESRDTRANAQTQQVDIKTGQAKKAWAGCKKGWVCLYEKKNGKGRMLKFNSGGWQNLHKYGFANKTSSLWNRMTGIGSSVHLSTGKGGTGKVVEYDQGKAKSLGNYNNRFKSINP